MITVLSWTTGEPARPLGKVIRPSSSISECCHSSLPSPVKAEKMPAEDMQ